MSDAEARILRNRQLLELLTFLFLITPSMAFSFLAIKQGSVGFVLTAASTILRDVALVFLILYFLWRNREPRSAIGWEFSRLGRELILGALLFVPFFYATSLLERLFLGIGLKAPSTPLPGLGAANLAQAVLGVLLVAVVAWAEETIFRGYLILRLQTLLGSWLAAAICASFIFSIGHGYEGSAGVVTVGVMGFIFATVYRWRGSLVAPMTMHFLQDIASIVILPYFLKGAK
jgi:membrane protease YdiL (CAAX protease family)